MDDKLFLHSNAAGAAAIFGVTLAKEEVALAAEKGLLKALSKADCICY